MIFQVGKTHTFSPSDKDDNHYIDANIFERKFSYILELELFDRKTKKLLAHCEVKSPKFELVTSEERAEKLHFMNIQRAQEKLKKKVIANGYNVEIDFLVEKYNDTKIRTDG